MAEVCTWKA